MPEELGLENRIVFAVDGGGSGVCGEVFSNFIQLCVTSREGDQRKSRAAQCVS